MNSQIPRFLKTHKLFKVEERTPRKGGKIVNGEKKWIVSILEMEGSEKTLLFNSFSEYRIWEKKNSKK